MTLNWEGLDIGILGPACVAGLIVLSTHVPLGKQVLNRGIIFIDLAIAQIAGLGVILAQYLGVDEHGLGVQFAAAAAALAGAGLLAWTDRRWPQQQEPLIGTLFVLAATGGLLLLADNPQGGEHLKDLLVGQILWVSYAQLIPAAILSALLLGVMWLRGGRLAGLVILYGVVLGVASLAVSSVVGLFFRLLLGQDNAATATFFGGVAGAVVSTVLAVISYAFVARLYALLSGQDLRAVFEDEPVR